MFEDFEVNFFSALKDDAHTRLGADHPCSLAIKTASETGAPADIENARKQMALLPQTTIEPMMAAAHKTMRENPEALLKLWSSDVKPGNFH